LSFQVPMFASSAATHADAAVNNITNDNKQIILFMEFSLLRFFLSKQEDFGDEWPQLDPSEPNDSTVTR
jgi:hypothetical protein